MTTISFSQENKEIIEEYLEDNFFDICLKALPHSYPEYKLNGKIPLRPTSQDYDDGFNPGGDYFPLAGTVTSNGSDLDAVLFDDLIEFAMEIAYIEDGVEFYMFEGQKYIEERSEFLKKFNIECNDCSSLTDQEEFFNVYYSKIVLDYIENKTENHIDFLKGYKTLVNNQEQSDKQNAINWINKNRNRFFYPSIKFLDKGNVKEVNLTLYQYVFSLLDKPMKGYEAAFLNFYDEFIAGNEKLEKEFLESKPIKDNLTLLLNSNLFEFNLNSPYLLVVYNRLLNTLQKDSQFLQRKEEGKALGLEYFINSYRGRVDISGSFYSQDFDTPLGHYVNLEYTDKGLKQIRGVLELDSNNFEITINEYSSNRILIKKTIYSGTFKDLKKRALSYSETLLNKYGVAENFWMLNFKIDTDFLYELKNVSDEKVVKTYDENGFPSSTERYNHYLPQGLYTPPNYLSAFLHYWNYPKNLIPYDIELRQKEGSFNGKSWMYFKDKNTNRKYKYGFIINQNIYDIYLKVSPSDLTPI